PILPQRIFFVPLSSTPPFSTLSLHDALPIYHAEPAAGRGEQLCLGLEVVLHPGVELHVLRAEVGEDGDVEDAAVDPAEHQGVARSEEHTSELQSRENLVCRLLLEKKNVEEELVIVHFAQYDCNGEFLRYTRLGGDCHVPPV